MKKQAYLADGRFYKGNLHTHTTVSDGKLSPREIAVLYRSKGYSFLSLTDHNIYGIHAELSEKDFIVIPGVEIDIFRRNKFIHVVGIGQCENRFAHGEDLRGIFDRCNSIDDVAEYLGKNGNLSIVAHPAWSRLDFSDIAAAKKIVGFEIYNHVCETNWANGDCGAFAEKLYSEKSVLKSFCSDDNHSGGEDSVKAYIMVKTKSLTHADIVDAVKTGGFYSSTGPEIYDFYIEDGKAHVSCSAVRRINFVTDSIFSAVHFYDSNANLRCAVAKMPNLHEASLIRAVLTDKDGGKAYTQPIFL
jgi:predicted metal-dependent phosphoesterase TrpH